MKSLIILVLAAIASTRCEEYYKSKFDNIDVDSVMRNERLVHNHLKCLFEDKVCTPEMEELKRRIPEIMETCCAKCTKKHKETARKVAEYFTETQPDIVKNVLNKFDPERKYVKKCSEVLEASGIDLSKF